MILSLKPCDFRTYIALPLLKALKYHPGRTARQRGILVDKLLRVIVGVTDSSEEVTRLQAEVGRLENDAHDCDQDDQWGFGSFSDFVIDGIQTGAFPVTTTRDLLMVAYYSEHRAMFRDAVDPAKWDERVKESLEWMFAGTGNNLEYYETQYQLAQVAQALPMAVVAPVIPGVPLPIFVPPPPAPLLPPAAVLPVIIPVPSPVGAALQPMAAPHDVAVARLPRQQRQTHLPALLAIGSPNQAHGVARIPPPPPRALARASTGFTYRWSRVHGRCTFTSRTPTIPVAAHNRLAPALPAPSSRSGFNVSASSEEDAAAMSNSP